VFAGALTATLISWDIARDAIRDRAHNRFEGQVNRILSLVENRMAAYEQLMFGAQALFATGQPVTREGWERFVQTLQVRERYPGTQAVGFAAYVREGERDGHVAQIRATDRADYAIRPPGVRAVSTPIVYNAPSAGRNRVVVGFDMFAEPVRREAIERARDTGRPALSGRVVLAGEATESSANRQPGFVMYVPIYDGSDAPQTIEARRERLRGLAFMPLRAADLMHGVLDAPAREVRARILDGMTTDAGSLLYDSLPLDGGEAPAQLTQIETLEIAGHRWTIELSSRPAFEAEIDADRPLVILITGFAIALLLLAATTLLRTVWLRERRYRSYTEIGSDWLWELDAASRFTYVSGRITDMLGVEPAALIGRPQEEAYAEFDGDVVQQTVRAHLRAEIEARRPFRDIELRTRHASSGAERVVRVSGWPRFSDGGRFLGYRGVGTDVTLAVAQQRQLVQARIAAEAASKAKSDFLAMMSHELRTPLNAVIGFAETLRDGRLGAATARRLPEYARHIYDSGRHLLDLINDILDMSKIEAGEYMLSEAEIELGSVVVESVTMLRERAATVGVSLRSDGPDVVLRADLRAVRQMLLNLLSNAIKFTDAGGSATVLWHVAPDGGVAVTVRDTGIGIPAAEIAGVTEPFRQAQSNRVRRRQGTGLGLSITKRLIEMHGGRLTIRSELGVGTSVDICFPGDRLVGPCERRAAVGA
jgi:PAS domain S-box-containing protein